MLYKEFLANNQRQIHKSPHYFPIYQRFFEKFKNQSIVIWEIGVGRGGSLQMWKSYFGPFVTIVGIDILPQCKQYKEAQIHIRVGDQTEVEFLQSVIDEFGVPDIIIDDGSHQMKDISSTFNYLYPKLANNGIYLVEDLHCAYWEDFGGGLKREGSFIEECKEMIDMLNSNSFNSPCEFGDTTFSISFFPSVVVFEKMRCSLEAQTQLTIPSEDEAYKEIAKAAEQANRKLVIWGYANCGKRVAEQFKSMQLPFYVTDKYKKFEISNQIENSMVLENPKEYYVVVCSTRALLISKQLKEAGYQEKNYFCMW